MNKSFFIGLLVLLALGWVARPAAAQQCAGHPYVDPNSGVTTHYSYVGVNSAGQVTFYAPDLGAAMVAFQQTSNAGLYGVNATTRILNACGGVEYSVEAPPSGAAPAATVEPTAVPTVEAALAVATAVPLPTAAPQAVVPTRVQGGNSWVLGVLVVGVLAIAIGVGVVMWQKGYLTVTLPAQAGPAGNAPAGEPPATPRPAPAPQPAVEPDMVDFGAPITTTGAPTTNQPATAPAPVIIDQPSEEEVVSFDEVRFDDDDGDGKEIDFNDLFVTDEEG